MSFALDQASNVLAIAEDEYGTGREIRFTTFTSCLGVIAMLDGNQGIGIHLVLVNKSKEEFEAGDVKVVEQLLIDQKYEPTMVVVIGAISFWEESAPDAYEALIEALKPSKTYAFGDGIYGAKFEDGEIELTYA